MNSSGATIANTSVQGQLASWSGHHVATLKSSLVAMLQGWISSLMTWLVIGIALALPAIFYLILVNVTEISGDWDGQPRVSLYLKADVTVAEAQAFATELDGSVAFSQVTFISPADALKDFQARTGFGNILESLPNNPLPSVVELIPVEADVGTLRLQVTALQEDARVDTLVFDLAWIERLFALIALGERLVLALSLVLAAGVVLVIGNTIRLAIENRRSEIEIVKLVGATDAFVRRPFLYLGFWFGLGGALMALILVGASLFFLSYPVEAIAQSYRDQFSLIGLGLVETLLLLGLGALLGVLGAMVAVGRHLRRIEPS